MRRPLPERSKYHVEAIERGLAVLAQFDQGRPQMSLTEIASGLDCALSSAMRILRTLEDLGFVEQDLETGNYRPGFSAVRLGHASITGSRLHKCAVPVLVEVFERLKVSVNLDVLIDHECCRVERLNNYNLLPDYLIVGTFFPVYCTAAGRALIMYLGPKEIAEVLSRQSFARYTQNTPTTAAAVNADLQRSRVRGYVFSNQEFSENLQVVAAPVRDAGGQTVAAVSISSPTHLVSAETVHAIHAREAMAAALRISAALADNSEADAA